MRILKNQIIYQCSYCGKRLLSKKGAKLHEEEYCWHSKSPSQIGIRERQLRCKHLRVATEYTCMPKGIVKEPAYSYCLDCGERIL